MLGAASTPLSACFMRVSFQLFPSLLTPLRVCHFRFVMFTISSVYRLYPRSLCSVVFVCVINHTEALHWRTQTHMTDYRFFKWSIYIQVFSERNQYDDNVVFYGTSDQPNSFVHASYPNSDDEVHAFTYFRSTNFVRA